MGDKIKTKYLLIALFTLIIITNSWALAPNNVDVNINNNSLYTNSVSVQLQLDANNATQMRFSCDGRQFTPLENYSTTKTFDLTDSNGNCSSDDGSRTITFQAKNDDGETSATATIILDREKPSISSSTPDINSWSNNNQPTITINLTEETTDINSETINLNVNSTDYTTLNSELSYSNKTITFVPGISYSDGNLAIVLTVSDLAGNQLSQTWHISIDTLNPTDVTGLTVEDLNNGTTVNLTWNPVSDANQYKIYKSTSPITDVTSLNGITISGTITDYNLTNLTYNTKYYFAVTALDKALNEDKTPIEIVNLTTTDTTAPAMPSDPVLSEVCKNTIKLTWTPNSESDIAFYRIYRDFDSTVDLNGETLIGTLNHSTCSTSCVFTDTNSLVNETTYYYKLVAIDNAGNSSSVNSGERKATTQTCNVLSAPIVTSPTHSNQSTWYNNDDLTLNWNLSEATNYSFLLDNSSETIPDNIGEGNVTTQDYVNLAEGIYYFHIKGYDGSKWGNTAHFKIQIDKTNPSNPSNLSLSISGKTVNLTWTTSSDSLSGIKHYEIFRGPNSEDMSKIAEVSGTNYSEEPGDLLYHYKIKAIDNAGNSSDITASIIADFTSNTTTNNTTNNNTTNNSTCDLSITIDLPEFAKIGKHKYKISANNEMKNVSVKMQKTGKSEEVLSSGENGTKLEKEFEIKSEDEGEILFTFLISDKDLDECNQTKTVKIDKEDPKINWLNPTKTSREIEDEIELKTKVTDKTSHIKQVNFYYIGEDGIETKIGQAEQHGEEYLINWNFASEELLSGKYYLKAIAEDLAGNKKAETIEVQLKSSYIPKEKQEYLFEKDKISELVEKIFKGNALLNEAKELLKTNDVKRELNLSPVKDSNKFKAEIIISYTNNTQLDQNIQIIEVIPKEFVKLASQLISDYNFVVLENDPIIQFNLNNVKPGEEMKLSYSLKDTLTKEEKDKLLEEKIINKFSSPPIPLYAETEIIEALKINTQEKSNNTATALAIFDFDGIIKAISSLISSLALLIVLIVLIGGIGLLLVVYNSHLKPKFDLINQIDQQDLDEQTNLKGKFVYKEPKKPQKSKKLYEYLEDFLRKKGL